MGLSKRAQRLAGLALLLTTLAANAGEILNGPEALIDAPAILTADTNSDTHAIAHELADTSVSHVAPIVLETLTPATAANATGNVVYVADSAMPLSMQAQASARYRSIFDRLVITISVTYQPGEHAVGYDSRPPGIFAMSEDTVLRFGTNTNASTRNLAILTRSTMILRH